MSSTKGVASGSGCTSIEQTKQSRYKFNAMLKHMFMLSHIVNGIDDLGSICHMLVEVVLKSKFKFKLQILFKLVQVAFADVCTL